MAYVNEQDVRRTLEAAQCLIAACQEKLSTAELTRVRDEKGARPVRFTS